MQVGLEDGMYRQETLGLLVGCPITRRRRRVEGSACSIVDGKHR
jgi:hypothetical protein